MRVSQTIRPGQPFNPYRQFNGVFIPEALLSMSSVSAPAKLLYGQLARHGGRDGNAYPSYATLAKAIGLSERQIIRLVKELIEARLVEVRKRTHENGRQRSNAYVFLWHEAFEARAPEVQIEGDMVDPEGDESVTGEGDTDVTPEGDASVTHKRVLSEESPSEKKHTHQQQQQLSAHQQGPNPPAAAVLSEDFPFRNTLKTLKHRFPSIKATHKWAKVCEESGLSDACIERFIDDAGGVWAFVPEATTPVLVVEEATAQINRQRQEMEAFAELQARSDDEQRFLNDRVRGVVYPDAHGKAGPCKCGERGLVAVNGEPRCSTCNALRDDLPQSDKWCVLGLCEQCGYDKWQPLDEENAVCSKCMRYRSVDPREITVRLFQTVKLYHCCDDELFEPDQLCGGGPCSACEGEWILKFDSGLQDCARCCIDDLAKFNRPLLLEYVEQAPEVFEEAKSAIRALEAFQAQLQRQRPEKSNRSIDRDVQMAWESTPQYHARLQRLGLSIPLSAAR